MSTVFRYRAIKPGTLSGPYRFISEGQLVTSSVPLDNVSFLVRESEYRAHKELPITSRTKLAPNPQHVSFVPTRPDAAYQSNINKALESEGRQAVEPAQDVVLAPARIVVGEESQTVGSGNQDVLG